jgi:hypothetical protein
MGHCEDAVGTRGPTTPQPPPLTDGVSIMLWTILVILVIIALVLFIVSRVRGGRGGV